ncbi:hypothetical protein AB0L41_46685 [Amycolatopsis mediterranei]|uniref:hypothetical protein n=1 Tax=Amycolatopsis mediterranei TaxID=33910 RepID=UPI00342B4FD4
MDDLPAHSLQDHRQLFVLLQSAGQLFERAGDLVDTLRDSSLSQYLLAHPRRPVMTCAP